MRAALFREIVSVHSDLVWDLKHLIILYSQSTFSNSHVIRASNSCWIKPKLHVGQAEIKLVFKKAFWASVGLQLLLPHDNILYVFCNACITADVDVIHLTPTCIQDLKILELVHLQQLISSSYSVIREPCPSSTKDASWGHLTEQPPLSDVPGAGKSQQNSWRGKTMDPVWEIWMQHSVAHGSKNVRLPGSKMTRIFRIASALYGPLPTSASTDRATNS